MQQSLLHRANVSSMHLNVQQVHMGEDDKRGRCCFWCRPIVLGDLLDDAGGHQHVQGHAGCICVRCVQMEWRWRWPPRTLIKFAFLRDNWGNMPQLWSAQVFAVVPVWGHCHFMVLTARFKSNGIAAMLTRSLTASLPGSRFKGGSTPG